MVRASFQDGVWIWGGRDEPNSISDAEQLLCLLYPATEIEPLALERPDEMAKDAASALQALGVPVAIPQKIVDVLADYLDRYTDEDGEPVFAAGSYLRTASDDDGPDAAGPRRITEEQLAIEVVDSYSISVTLCLSALGFVKVYKPGTEKVGRVEQGFRDRLTCAMIGLLRSFVVRTEVPTDPARGVISHTTNLDGTSNETVLGQRLLRIRKRVQDDVQIGVNVDKAGLDARDMLFEIGWGWGIVQTAPPVALIPGTTWRIASREGIAEPRLYLHSTLAALYGINDLRSARTRVLGLLGDEQRTLNEALQLRWDLTQRYWATLARLGARGWLLEDVPWRTSDGEESDYFSLLVSAILLQDLENREASNDDVDHLAGIFESLAERGRITRRVTFDDAAIVMHVPGVEVALGGTEALGPQLYWYAADFAPLLFRAVAAAARLAATIGVRERVLRLAETSMDHL